MPSTCTTMNPSSASEVIHQLYEAKVLGTYWSPGPEYMYSTTGYFFCGSKSDGRYIMPHMSVLPSRPLALKVSGAVHPLASSAEMSAFSSGMTVLPVSALRTSATGACCGVLYTSTIYLWSDEYQQRCIPSSGVSSFMPEPSKFMR